MRTLRFGSTTVGPDELAMKLRAFRDSELRDFAEQLLFALDLERRQAADVFGAAVEEAWRKAQSARGEELG